MTTYRILTGTERPEFHADKITECQPNSRMAVTMVFAPETPHKHIRAVALLASSEGLKVKRHPSPHAITLRGTASIMQHVFNVELKMHETADGIFRCRKGPVGVPTSFGSRVTAVLGLDTRPAATPHYRAHANPQAGANGYTARQLASIYGFPGGGGHGHSVGIIELGGAYQPNAMQAYFRRAGIELSPNVTVKGTQHPRQTDASVEVMLDVEIVASIVPRARTVVYFGANTTAGFYNAVARAVAARHDAISISWGGEESSWTGASMDAMNALAQTAGTAGVTITAASGDNGSSDGGSGLNCVIPETIIAGTTMRRASAVNVGDTVFGHDGKLHAVSHVFSRHYNGNIVRIASSTGVGISVTEKHPVLVYRWVKKRELPPETTHPDPDLARFTSKRCPRWGVYAAKWIQAKDVRKGDYIATPKLDCPDTDTSPFPATESTAWLLGNYAGDGWLLKNEKGLGKGIGIAAAKRDVDRICAAMTGIGLKPSVFPVGTGGIPCDAESATSFRVMGYSRTICSRFGDWFGTKAAEKHLPAFLFHGWPLAAVLSGLLAADGHVESPNDIRGIRGSKPNRRVNFSTVSKILAQQVRMIAATLGHQPTILSLGRPADHGWSAYPNSQHAYRVNWTDNGKQSKCHFSGNMLLAPVRAVSVEPYLGTVFNFDVEDVHSYLADTIITHNCDFPASAPNILGCGGTNLTATDGVYGSETVWNSGGYATGGGYSAHFSLPDYQAAVNIGGNTHRMVPDVAANADPDTGYFVRVNGQSMEVGGTSASAPMWAALICRLNAALGRRLGFIQLSLYGLAPGSLRDIVSGSNGAYEAGVGFDCATGLGSPPANLQELLS